ncbi:hypothetical protein [Haloarcula sp. 1CSR25-25]|uniref:hypothetical protein n=1 Tax=Haloarcula sp. 1CSR25-25 TaxID=2862545 RepID=UPI002893DBF1|nr:hypothetical protein [Haloarcula sp. 1CSR25-25]MDT3435473.1 hypothetical protein [Haloarcula sp. 1CSR25-25]
MVEDQNKKLDCNSLPIGRRNCLRLAGGTIISMAGLNSLSATGKAGSKPIGETGLLTASQPDEDTWHTVTLDRSYSEPVVIMKAVSNDGFQPVHIRLQDVSDNSFQYKFEEWDYLDGQHTEATASYVVVEKGSHTLADETQVEAGTKKVKEKPKSIKFSDSFSDPPIVFSQGQTYKGGQAIVTRNESISTGGFETRLQEMEQFVEGHGGRHTNETVGYLAIQPTAASDYEIGRTGNEVTEDWHSLSFSGSYEDPIFITDMQTTDGGDSAGLRYANLSSTGADVRVEEEQSFDDETSHTSEQVGYLVANQGSLFDSSDSSGGTDDDTDVSVATTSPSNVAETSVTFNGDLTDLGGASSADVYFEWGESDTSLGNTTASQTLSSIGGFSVDQSNLESGTEYEYQAVAAASDGDEATGSKYVFTTTSTDSTSEYFDGQRLYSSDYSSLQAAVDDASVRDVVVVDANETLTSTLRIKDDIKLEGDGGTLSVPSDGDHGIGLYGPLKNVWIDGLTLIGPGQKPVLEGNYGIGGPGDNGPLQNIRITNNRIEEFPNNGISFTVWGSNDADDIYVANNTVVNSGSHGMVFGCGEVGESNSNEISNLLVENNIVDGVDQAQGIGTFGHSGGVTHHVAFVGNVSGRQTQNDRGGTAMAFEEDTHHCVAYGNETHTWNRGNLGVIAKNGQYNLIANHYAHDGPSGLNCNNYNYYLPEGPPTKNIYTHNYVDNCNKGVHYKNIDSPGNVFYHNRFSNVGTELSLGAPALDGSSDQPRVWDRTTDSDTGLLDTIGDGATFTTPSGEVGADVSWQRGSTDPSDPVVVTVDTYPDRY